MGESQDEMSSVNVPGSKPLENVITPEAQLLLAKDQPLESEDGEPSVERSSKISGEEKTKPILDKTAETVKDTFTKGETSNTVTDAESQTQSQANSNGSEAASATEKDQNDEAALKNSGAVSNSESADKDANVSGTPERQFDDDDLKDINVISATVEDDNDDDSPGRDNNSPSCAPVELQSDDITNEDADNKEDSVSEEGVVNNNSQSLDQEVEQSCELTENKPPLKTKEMEMIGAEIIFVSDNSVNVDGWTNMKWLSTNGERKLRHCGPVNRLNNSSKKSIFSWGAATEQYVPRRIAIFEEPSLIIILRQPINAAEVRQLLEVTSNADLGADSDTALTEGYLVAESVIEPKTCKLRLSPLTTCTSVESTASEEQNDDRRKSCFELLTPLETIVLSAMPARANKERASFTDSVQFLETSILEVAVGKELYMAHCPTDHDDRTDVSWKHQIILGTLHSFVVCGSQNMLDKALQAAITSRENDNKSSGLMRAPSRVINAQDEMQRTPLHYALIRRSSLAVQALTKAGADCTVPMDCDDTSPCHWCSRNLDDQSLSMLLSASFPKRPDPNALDTWGRTAMYVAAIEGRSSNGSHDPAALGRCLSALVAWGGQFILEGEQDIQPLRHPVSELASCWRAEELSAVFSHVSFRYPFHTSDTPDNKLNMSLSAAFHYPVHSALIAILNDLQMIRDGSIAHRFGRDEALEESKLISTLRILFEHGFEPNEKLEGVLDDFYGYEQLMSYMGYAPIQILAAVALEVNDMSTVDQSGTKEENSAIDLLALKRVMRVVSSAALFLVENGARLNLDIPATKRLDRKSSSRFMPDQSAKANEVLDSKNFEVDRSKLKIDSNKTVIKSFGGDEVMNAAKKKWVESSNVPSNGKMNICRDKSNVTLTDEDAPGGNDEKSCSICWRAFGKLLNRKHRCRATMRYVCDECSTKRILDRGEEYRVSDGQFLLATADAGKQIAKKMKEESEKERSRKARVEKMLNERRTSSSNKEDEDNRNSLFGGVDRVMGKAASYVFGDESEDAKEDIHGKVGGLASSLGQTKDALNERGDKLNSLADKTDRLLDASRGFADMAKQLERQQNSWW